jgi:Zn-dependent protease with chaperone function
VAPIHGRYFDAQRSRPVAAILSCDGEEGVRLQAEAVTRSDVLSTVVISDRIGAIPRRLRFPDGALFETDDNDAIDALLPGARMSPGWVHRLEQRWRVVLLSLLAVVATCGLFLQFGMPWLAHRVADALPPGIDAAIGARSLEILDRSLLLPSALPEARQQQLNDLFNRMAADAGSGQPLRLVLRDSKALGANAFALPAGTVILTDSLVAMSRDDEELQAVLAHEIGHVRQRHALRQLLQGAGVSAMSVVLFGDLTSLSALTGAVPLLLQAKHSRDFEREADAFARRWLAAHRIATHRFDDILCRMTIERNDDRADLPDYLSTHPPTQDRAACAAGGSRIIREPAHP